MRSLLRLVYIIGMIDEIFRCGEVFIVSTFFLTGKETCGLLSEMLSLAGELGVLK